MGRPGVEEEEPNEFRESPRPLSREFKAPQLLQEMISPGWRASTEWQEDTFCKMRAAWGGFAEHERDKAFHNSKGHINRLKITVGDDEKLRIFHRIMGLKTDSQVRRAMMWDPAKWKPYVPEVWEKDYLNLPGFIGRYIDCYKESKIPTPFLFWSGMSVLSACCKYNVYVQVGGQELLHNLFMFLVGDAGQGKSYSKDCAEAIFTILNDKLNTEVQPKVADGITTPITVDRPDLWINMFPNESTYEAIVEAFGKIRSIILREVLIDSSGHQFLSLNENHNCADAAGILMVDEVAEHFAKGDWAADKKLAGYTSMFTSTKRSRSTISRGTIAYDHQAFSMMVCGAVEWFKGAVTPAMMQGGFMDRAQFIYRNGTHRIYTALTMPVVDPIMEEDLAMELIPLVVPPNSLRRRVRFTTGAEKLLDEISMKEFQREIDVRDLKFAKSENYTSTAVRREHRKIKVSSLLTISESLGQQGELVIAAITKDHVRRADKLIANEDIFFDKFLDAVNLTGATEFCIWLHDQFIRYSKNGKWQPITQSQMLSKCLKKPGFKVYNVSDLHHKLSPLVDAGVITRIEVKKTNASKTTKTAWTSVDDKEVWGPFL